MFFMIAFWLACAYWVFKDARRRVEDPIILVVCVLTGLVFGPLGLLIYSIVRPAELIVDSREREMEMEMMAAAPRRLRALLVLQDAGARRLLRVPHLRASSALHLRLVRQTAGAQLACVSRTARPTFKAR